MMTAVSLFAGVGGIDLALERCGVKVTAAVEIDKAARGVLAERFPTTTLFPDVTKVTGDDIRATGFVPQRGIVTAGWPCQGNSIAGRRRGLADPRSGLWAHVVRLLDDLRPAWFLGENVPGLLSVTDGEDFGQVLQDLADLGMGFAYRVLDAQFFGVPQRRRRVFIVGRAGDSGAASVRVLLEPEGGGGNPPQGHPAGPDIAATLTAGVARAGVSAPGRRQEDEMNLVPTLTARYGKGTSSDADDGIIVQTQTSVRRLTPLECERLQGFPDAWTATSNGKPQSDSARYRQMGNSVAVPCVEWIVSRIVAEDARDLGAVVETIG